MILEKISAVIQWGRSRAIVVTLLKLTLLHRPVVALLRLTSIEETSRHKSWERKAILFYSQFVSRDSLCFDIGANVGSRTAVFRKLGASVVAVEPQDNCLKRLKKMHGADSQVKIVQKVVGSCEGEAELRIVSEGNGASSSCSNEWISAIQSRGPEFARSLTWNKVMKVPMTTLDSLITQFGTPRFCKIDVEGFEHEVVKGLSRPIEALSIEYNPAYLAPAIDSIRRLSGLGLTRFNYSVDESMELVLPKWVAVDEIINILGNLPDKTSYGDVYATIR